MTDYRNLIVGKSTKCVVFCFLFYLETHATEVLLPIRKPIIDLHNIPTL